MILQTIRETFHRLMGSVRHDKPVGKFPDPAYAYNKPPPPKGAWGSASDGKPVKKPSV